MANRIYVVRAGCAVHTKDKSYGPGEEVTLSETEAQSHLHKLEAAATAPPTESATADDDTSFVSTAP